LDLDYNEFTAKIQRHNVNSPEITLYLNRARQDLRAAQSNLDQGFYEVTVSRAYYAMFNSSRALLTEKGIAPRKHSGVHSAFSEHFVKTGLIETEYAKMLGQAFDSRLDSDYDVMFIVEQALAETVLRDAQRFVNRVETDLHEVGVL
jgi:uncharacterized protein (UPF0332 family)